MEDNKDINLLDRYVEPHKIISRNVEEKDLLRVAEEAHIMYQLCFMQRGIHKGAYAIAHCQIDDKDPLRFFVTYNKKLVINPVILRHTRHTVESEEGCLSFPEILPVTVQRWNKCEVEYYTIYTSGDVVVMEKVVENLSGLEAKIYQHEINHMDSIYIINLEEYLKQKLERIKIYDESKSDDEPTKNTGNEE